MLDLFFVTIKLPKKRIMAAKIWNWMEPYEYPDNANKNVSSNQCFYFTFSISL